MHTPHTQNKTKKVTAHLLAGELAEDGGDVGGVGGHQSSDGALDLVRHSTATLGDHLLQSQSATVSVPPPLVPSLRTAMKRLLTHCRPC